MTHVPPLIVAPCNAKREISGCRLRLCAECTSNCLTCYYDTDGVNLCQACEPRYSLSDDSLQCNRKPLKNLYSRESVANMQAYGRRNKHTYIHIALVFLPQLLCTPTFVESLSLGYIHKIHVQQ